MDDKKANGTEELETRLRELDLSEQSKIKDSLCYELQQKIATNRLDTSRNTLWSRLIMLRRPLPALGLGIVLALAMIIFVHPDTLARLINYLNVYKVGEHTFVSVSDRVGETSIDSMLTDAFTKLESGQYYYIENTYGGYGGTVLEGREPVVKQVSSLSIASQMVDFPLLIPTYYHERIPRLYRFRWAQIMPDGSATVFFGLGKWETMLRYFPVGDNSSYSHSQQTMATDSTGNRLMRGVRPDLEELEVRGKQVFWQVHNDQWRKRLMSNANESEQDLVIGKFMWEADGISYTLDGRMLTKEEGIKIIESLKEMPKPNQ